MLFAGVVESHKQKTFPVTDITVCAGSHENTETADDNLISYKCDMKPAWNFDPYVLHVTKLSLRNGLHNKHPVLG